MLAGIITTSRTGLHWPSTEGNVNDGDQKLIPHTARWVAPLALLLLALWGCAGGRSGGFIVGVKAPPAPCQQSSGAGSVVVVVVVGSGLSGDPAIPEPQSGYKLGNRPVTAGSYMVVTANPLASEGFAISGRMTAAISGARNHLLRDPEAAAYFLNPDFSARALGSTIKNPA